MSNFFVFVVMWLGINGTWEPTAAFETEARCEKYIRVMGLPTHQSYCQRVEMIKDKING